MMTSPLVLYLVLVLFSIRKPRGFNNQTCGHPETSHCKACFPAKLTFQAEPWFWSSPEKQGENEALKNAFTEQLAGPGCRVNLVHSGFSVSSNQIE